MKYINNLKRIIQIKRLITITFRYLPIFILPFAIFFILISSSEKIGHYFTYIFLDDSLVQFLADDIIIYTLSIGYILSFLFWAMNIALPENRKRRLLRNRLKKRYKFFRYDVIRILLDCYETWRRNHNTKGNLKYLGDQHGLVEKLCDYKEFRNFFSANEHQNWYAVLNGIQFEKSHLSDLYIEFQLLADEITYVLNNVDIYDDEVISFFNYFFSHTYRLKNASVYSEDQAKYLGSFLWQILAQWSMVNGQIKKDPILKTINQI